MKAIAFFLIICIVSLSAFPARAIPAHTELKKACCHELAKKSPCSHNNQGDCNSRGICNIIVCSSCGFLKVDPLSIKPIIPIPQELNVTPYYLGSLSDYSLSSWHPPKV
jgi:hypothetical protein